MSPRYINTRGASQGTCNICGEVALLTEDHTPPKGWVKPTQVMLQHISRHLGAGPEVKGRHSQNGVNYRTLCGRCNNDVLGSRCDQALIDFVGEVARYTASEVHLPEVMTIRARPQAIMRSVIGHLSAQGVDRYLKGPHTEAVRDYMLDPTLPLPGGIYVYQWVYPYRSLVLVRDAAYADRRHDGKAVHFWLMKAFPMAFLVTWDRPMVTDEPITELSAWRDASFGTAAELPVRVRPLVLPTWPEAPTETSILAYGPEAVTVLPSRGKKGGVSPLA